MHIIFKFFQVKYNIKQPLCIRHKRPLPQDSKPLLMSLSPILITHHVTYPGVFWQWTTKYLTWWCFNLFFWHNSGSLIFFATLWTLCLAPPSRPPSRAELRGSFGIFLSFSHSETRSERTLVREVWWLSWVASSSYEMVLGVKDSPLGPVPLNDSLILVRLLWLTFYFYYSRDTWQHARRC